MAIKPYAALPPGFPKKITCRKSRPPVSGVGCRGGGDLRILEGRDAGATELETQTGGRKKTHKPSSFRVLRVFRGRKSGSRGSHSRISSHSRFATRAAMADVRLNIQNRAIRDLVAREEKRKTP
jgi:hypothetical protein